MRTLHLYTLPKRHPEMIITLFHHVCAIALAAAIPFTLSGCRLPVSEVKDPGLGREIRERIAAQLLEARAAKQAIPPISATYGHFSIDEAYLIQDLLTKELQKKYGSVSGYKIGFATPDDFERLGIDEPSWGRLYSQFEVASGGTISIDDFLLFHIENELTFVIDTPIERKIQTTEQLIPHIRSIHAGFDIADNIYHQDGHLTVSDHIANGIGAAIYVLGPAVKVDSIDDIDNLTLTIYKNGESIYEGTSNKVFGSPWNVIKWLANDLIDRGDCLKAGDVILSGKVAPAYRAADDGARGEYVGVIGEAFGDVRIRVE